MWAKQKVFKRWFVLVVASVVTLGGAAVANAQMPPQQVEVIKMSVSEVRHWDHFPGRISAVETVEVLPLVGGRIDQVLFRDGDHVKQGQKLFVIDPRPFIAAVQRAEAALVTAKAQARLAKQELDRSQELLTNKLISQSLFDEAFTAREVAAASVLLAESDLITAKLNLEYSQVTAPISGRVGRAELTVGNIVAAGPTAPMLTSIVADEVVYAEFQMDEQRYLNLLKGSNENQSMPVELKIPDMAERVFDGSVYSFDNQLDVLSGTIRVRAIFDNSDGFLLTGMYGDLRVGASQKQHVYLLPERAVGTNQDRKFVYVVDDNSTVQYREVTLGRQVQGQREVLSGVKSGEHVVVNGIARIRPQMPVQPVLASNENARTTEEVVSAESF